MWGGGVFRLWFACVAQSEVMSVEGRYWLSSPVTIYLSPVTFRALRFVPIYVHADFVKTGARRDVERFGIGVAEAAVGRD